MHLPSTPTKIFLLDAIGALISTFLLLGLLPFFHQEIGLEKGTLYFLGGIAACYSGFSLSCFFFVRKSSSICLKMLILANLGYCVLSAGVVTVYLDKMTLIGLAYFALEVVVLLAISALELHVLLANVHSAVKKT